MSLLQELFDQLQDLPPDLRDVFTVETNAVAKATVKRRDDVDFASRVSRSVLERFIRTKDRSSKVEALQVALVVRNGFFGKMFALLSAAIDTLDRTSAGDKASATQSLGALYSVTNELCDTLHTESSEWLLEHVHTLASTLLKRLSQARESDAFRDDGHVDKLAINCAKFLGRAASANEAHSLGALRLCVLGFRFSSLMLLETVGDKTSNKAAASESAVLPISAALFDRVGALLHLLLSSNGSKSAVGTAQECMVDLERSVTGLRNGTQAARRVVAQFSKMAACVAKSAFLLRRTGALSVSSRQLARHVLRSAAVVKPEPPFDALLDCYAQIFDEDDQNAKAKTSTSASRTFQELLATVCGGICDVFRLEASLDESAARLTSDEFEFDWSSLTILHDLLVCLRIELLDAKSDAGSCATSSKSLPTDERDRLATRRITCRFLDRLVSFERALARVAPARALANVLTQCRAHVRTFVHVMVSDDCFSNTRAVSNEEMEVERTEALKTVRQLLQTHVVVARELDAVLCRTEQADGTLNAMSSVRRRFDDTYYVAVQYYSVAKFFRFTEFNLSATDAGERDVVQLFASAIKHFHEAIELKRQAKCAGTLEDEAFDKPIRELLAYAYVGYFRALLACGNSDTLLQILTAEGAEKNDNSRVRLADVLEAIAAADCSCVQYDALCECFAQRLVRNDCSNDHTEPQLPPPAGQQCAVGKLRKPKLPGSDALVSWDSLEPIRLVSGPVSASATCRVCTQCDALRQLLDVVYKLKQVAAAQLRRAPSDRKRVLLGTTIQRWRDEPFATRLDRVLLQSDGGSQQCSAVSDESLRALVCRAAALEARTHRESRSGASCRVELLDCAARLARNTVIATYFRYEAALLRLVRRAETSTNTADQLAALYTQLVSMADSCAQQTTSKFAQVQTAFMLNDLVAKTELWHLALRWLLEVREAYTRAASSVTPKPAEPVQSQPGAAEPTMDAAADSAEKVPSLVAEWRIVERLRSCLQKWIDWYDSAVRYLTPAGTQSKARMLLVANYEETLESMATLVTLFQVHDSSAYTSAYRIFKRTSKLKPASTLYVGATLSAVQFAIAHNCFDTAAYELRDAQRALIHTHSKTTANPTEVSSDCLEIPNGTSKRVEMAMRIADAYVRFRLTSVDHSATLERLHASNAAYFARRTETSVRHLSSLLSALAEMRLSSAFQADGATRMRRRVRTFLSSKCKFKKSEDTPIVLPIELCSPFDLAGLANRLAKSVLSIYVTSLKQSDDAVRLADDQSGSTVFELTNFDAWNILQETMRTHVRAAELSWLVGSVRETRVFLREAMRTAQLCRLAVPYARCSLMLVRFDAQCDADAELQLAKLGALFQSESNADVDLSGRTLHDIPTSSSVDDDFAIKMPKSLGVLSRRPESDDDVPKASKASHSFEADFLCDVSVQLSDARIRRLFTGLPVFLCTCPGRVERADTESTLLCCPRCADSSLTRLCAAYVATHALVTLQSATRRIASLGSSQQDTERRNVSCQLYKWIAFARHLLTDADAQKVQPTGDTDVDVDVDALVELDKLAVRVAYQLADYATCAERCYTLLASHSLRAADFVSYAELIHFLFLSMQALDRSDRHHPDVSWTPSDINSPLNLNRKSAQSSERKSLEKHVEIVHLDEALHNKDIKTPVKVANDNSLPSRTQARAKPAAPKAIRRRTAKPIVEEGRNNSTSTSTESDVGCLAQLTRNNALPICCYTLQQTAASSDESPVPLRACAGTTGVQGKASPANIVPLTPAARRTKQPELATLQRTRRAQRAPPTTAVRRTPPSSVPSAPVCQRVTRRTVVKAPVIAASPCSPEVKRAPTADEDEQSISAQQDAFVAESLGAIETIEVPRGGDHELKQKLKRRAPTSRIQLSNATASESPRRDPSAALTSLVTHERVHERITGKSTEDALPIGPVLDKRAELLDCEVSHALTPEPLTDPERRFALPATPFIDEVASFKKSSNAEEADWVARLRTNKQRLLDQLSMVRDRLAACPPYSLYRSITHALATHYLAQVDGNEKNSLKTISNSKDCQTNVHHLLAASLLSELLGINYRHNQLFYTTQWLFRAVKTAEADAATETGADASAATIEQHIATMDWLYETREHATRPTSHWAALLSRLPQDITVLQLTMPPIQHASEPTTSDFVVTVHNISGDFEESPFSFCGISFRSAWPQFSREFEDVMAANRVSMAQTNDVDRWWREREQVDSRLRAAIERIPAVFFDSYGVGALLGAPLSSSLRRQLMEQADQLSCKFAVQMRAKETSCTRSWLRILLNGAHLVTDDDLERGVQRAFSTHLTSGSLIRAGIVQKIRVANRQLELDRAERCCVLLLLDGRLRQIPFECVTLVASRRLVTSFCQADKSRDSKRRRADAHEAECDTCRLLNAPAANAPNNGWQPRLQSYTRMPSAESFAFLHEAHTGQLRVPTDTNKQVLSANISESFYVLNPESNLDTTEKTFAPEFAARGWVGLTRRAPNAEQLAMALARADVYMYCGHGSGSHFVSTSALLGAASRLRSVAVLMGCSSALLRVEPSMSDIEPVGMPLGFLMLDCPAVVGHLWDATDRDMDRYCSRLLELWCKHKAHSNATACVDRLMSANQLAFHLPTLVQEARCITRMRCLVGGAAVYYGLPVTTNCNTAASSRFRQLRVAFQDSGSRVCEPTSTT